MVEPSDECDRLIGRDESSTLIRATAITTTDSSKQHRAAKQQAHLQQQQQPPPGVLSTAAAWLPASLRVGLGQHTEPPSFKRKHSYHNHHHQHHHQNQHNSTWWPVSATERLVGAPTASEASYNILGDELEHHATMAGSDRADHGQQHIDCSTDDGFEFDDERGKGRRAAKYALKYGRARSLRLLALCACLLLLFGLSLVLLIRLAAMLAEQRPPPGRGGRAWLDYFDAASGGDGDGDGGDSSSPLDRAQLEAGRANRWLVSSPKCHIPSIEPWHESIREYVQRKPPMQCDQILQRSLSDPTKRPAGMKVEHSLTFTRDNRLYFTPEAIRLGYLDSRCCYSVVRRAGGSRADEDTHSYEVKENDDDELSYGDTCQVIGANGLLLDHDLIKIECYDRRLITPPLATPDASDNRTALKKSTLTGAGLTYTNVHSFIVHDLEEEQALDRVAARKLDRANYFNVLMLGVDTISRLNGYRQLNRTLTLLKRDFKTLEFVGYNKVGENTFPNLVPLLTGLTPEQLIETQCWRASNYSQSNEKGDDYMDNCKYLWNYYQELGFITYFSEDWPAASTFNYMKKGFRREPTTFYGRPFTLARRELLLPPVGMGCASCLLDQPLVGLDLQNLENFLSINRDRASFAFHWINCPQHDDLNGASRVDSIIEKFFASIKEFTHDNRTFVILFSDHGYRWNNFVSTPVGHYESSLPLLTIAPPRAFIEQHPRLYENLKRHQAALLTPFDMFRTLVDIRNLGLRRRPLNSGAGSPPAGAMPAAAAKSSSTSSSQQQQQQQRQQPADEINSAGGQQAANHSATTPNPLIFEDPQYTQGPTASTTISQVKLLDGLSYRQKFRPLSLLDGHTFAQLDRSCIDAGIPDNYCVCHEFEPTPTSGNDVLGAAYYLVYVHLYNRLKAHTNLCYPLDLEKIIKAELFDFKQMKSRATTKGRRRRRRRRDTSAAAAANNTTSSAASSQEATTAPPPPPPAVAESDESEKEPTEEGRSLPTREYNIRLSTRPGLALFQEVVRYYGDDNLAPCERAVQRAKQIIDTQTAGSELEFERKHKSVIEMNEACKFSIHSDSISRLNLYRDQSECVKSNIELKKICYCNNLPK